MGNLRCRRCITVVDDVTFTSSTYWNKEKNLKRYQSLKSQTQYRRIPISGLCQVQSSLHIYKYTTCSSAYLWLNSRQLSQIFFKKCHVLHIWRFSHLLGTWPSTCLTQQHFLRQMPPYFGFVHGWITDWIYSEQLT